MYIISTYNRKIKEKKFEESTRGYNFIWENDVSFLLPESNSIGFQDKPYRGCLEIRYRSLYLIDHVCQHDIEQNTGKHGMPNTIFSMLQNGK